MLYLSYTQLEQLPAVLKAVFVQIVGFAQFCRILIESNCKFARSIYSILNSGRLGFRLHRGENFHEYLLERYA